MAAQKSIVLVTVDCLRADHVGFMGYPRRTTPFLDSLAEQSLVFPTAIVAGAPTYYSLPAILASRYPLALGRDVLGLAPGEPTIASVLHDAGYATAAFAAGNPYISARFGYAEGFDTFRDFLDDERERLPENPETGKGWAGRLNRKLQKINSGVGPFGAVYDELYFQYCQRVTPEVNSLDALRRFPSADVIVDEACKWLDSAGDVPFFLWLHLMDPHAPYYPKESALAMMGDSPVNPSRARYLNSYWNRSDLGARRLQRHRDEIVSLYDAGIRWVDVQMSRLVEKLHLSKQWERCIFALTADHGEEFLDHGERFHPPEWLMEELIHVPLLVRLPGNAKREVVATPFSLLHLAPTLLDAAELPVPEVFQGLSRWREQGSADELAISECVSGCSNPFHAANRMGPRVLSVRDAQFKLLLRFDPPAEALYDLKRDPKELAPLLHEEKAARRRLLEAAREHLRRPIDQRTLMMGRVRELQLEWKKSANHSAPAVSQSASA
jgi:arylsulfatase A-like enzyme